MDHRLHARLREATIGVATITTIEASSALARPRDTTTPIAMAQTATGDLLARTLVVPILPRAISRSG